MQVLLEWPILFKKKNLMTSALGSSVSEAKNSLQQETLPTSRGRVGGVGITDFEF